MLVIDAASCGQDPSSAHDQAFAWDCDMAGYYADPSTNHSVTAIPGLDFTRSFHPKTRGFTAAKVFIHQALKDVYIDSDADASAANQASVDWDRSNDDPHNPLVLLQQTVSIESRDVRFKLRVGMDGATAAASIIGLAGAGVQIAIKLVILAMLISTAQDRVSSIDNGISITSGVLQQLGKLMSQKLGDNGSVSLVKAAWRPQEPRQRSARGFLWKLRKG
ncbi:hypothetical protein OEA41_001941 [Lepraria neglecta]|uniref:Uncharacterized protein n=1 Tax=Lepraria neglecta TaxID=209136 RepID=A0AAD9ZB34_9LECA|nr:hypothetical protein OEA41_001941 [Lepraria neglecta]